MELDKIQSEQADRLRQEKIINDFIKEHLFKRKESKQKGKETPKQSEKPKSKPLY